VLPLARQKARVDCFGLRPRNDKPTVIASAYLVIASEAKQSRLSLRLLRTSQSQ
jgi:hypothetical protein